MNKLFTFSCFFIGLLGCKSKDSGPVRELSDVAFVVSGGSKTVEVIDLINQELLEVYPLTNDSERFPHHIYLSGDKKTLAVANPKYDFSNGHLGLHGKQIGGGIILLDAHTGAKIQEYEVPFANHNALFSPDNSEVWTTGMSHSGKAYIYDSETGTPKAEVLLDADPSEIIFTADGKNAVVRSGESTFLQFVDVVAKEVVKIVKVDLSAGNVWPGYGNTVLVSNSDRKSVNFVSTSNYVVTDFVDFDFAPGFVIFNELRKELWVCNSAENSVEIFKREEGVWVNTHKLPFADADPHMIKFYDGEKRALLINQKENTVVFINTETKEIMKTISVGNKPNGIAIL